MKKHIAILIFAASAICLASCKNSKATAPKQEQTAPQTASEAQVQPADPADVDVVYLSTLFCKTTDWEMAKVFRGVVKDEKFTVKKDVENNYAIVYDNTQEESLLEFYLWTDNDGFKILGVNLMETKGKRHQKSLQFFGYDARLNLVVPIKRLNEIFTNKMLSLRKNISKFVFRLPTSPENENITLNYWEKKDKDKCNELVFKWDGHTFNL